MGGFKAALLQMQVSDSKAQNLEKAVQYIRAAAEKGADLAVLPEMFCCPYDNSCFRAFGEQQGGPAYQALSAAAAENGIYVVGGSVPELDEDRVYNTSYAFDRAGKEIAKHRKMHLFDIEVEGGQQFKESDVLSAGAGVTVFDTEFCKMGLMICYDIRFPELSRLMALMGAEVVVVPAAFNMTTGPAHWEISFRMRALDNQVYMIGAAPARDYEASYHAYGNSIVTAPWGDVVCRMDEKEGMLLQEIDLEQVNKVRRELPLLKHRRSDVYELGIR